MCRPGGGAVRRNLNTDPNGCNDKHEQCAEWAFFGECTKNTGFMNVECKKSCKQCTPTKA